MTVVNYDQGIYEYRLETLFKPSRLKDLTEAEKNYIAGLFDGEGTIVISLNKRDNRAAKMIKIGTTCKELVEWLHRKLGIGWTMNNRQKPGEKPVYRFQITRFKEIETFLSWIKDSLIVKRKQAELMLEFCDLAKQRRVRLLLNPDTKKIIRSLQTKISPREWEIYREIKELNKRGWEDGWRT